MTAAPDDDATGYDVVVPTIARPSLARLLDALAAQHEPLRGRVIVVEDEARRGPAAARNVGWRTSTAAWVAFLDDDVVPPPTWTTALHADLAAAAPDVGGVQGRIDVPLPTDRRPTDWERNVAGLASASWATADMAYRRAALAEVDGFDERFPRAYREDADLALRVEAAGWRLTVGTRTVSHPVPPAPWHVSVDKQRGNIDDAVMARLHGPDWRVRAHAPRGAFRRHLAVTALGVAAAATRKPALGAAWVAATAAFAWRRIAPGPRDAREVAAMAVTSVAIPPVAVWHRARGVLRALEVT